MALLWWIKTFSMDVQSHKTISNRSECIISAKCSKAKFWLQHWLSVFYLSQWTKALYRQFEFEKKTFLLLRSTSFSYFIIILTKQRNAIEREAANKPSFSNVLCLAHSLTHSHTLYLSPSQSNTLLYITHKHTVQLFIWRKKEKGREKERSWKAEENIFWLGYCLSRPAKWSTILILELLWAS